MTERYYDITPFINGYLFIVFYLNATTFNYSFYGYLNKNGAIANNYIIHTVGGKAHGLFSTAGNTDWIPNYTVPLKRTMLNIGY